MVRARLRAIVALGCLFLAVEAHAATESADSAAEARQQYKDGTKAFAAKRYSEAALHFEAAASFKANAVALFTAGLAWDLASSPDRAADAYARALDVPGLDPKQTKTATDRVAALEKTLGTLTVTLPEPGAKVQLDSATEVGVPARLHGTPGAHALSIRLPNKPPEKHDVMLEAGKVTPFERKEEPKPPARTDPEPDRTPAGRTEPPPMPARLREPPFWTAPRVAGVGVAGVGVATLFATALLGTSAESAKEAYEAVPSRKGFDHASSLETLTNVTLVAGGILLVGGVVLVLLPLGRDRAEVQLGHLRLGPRSNGLGGTF